MSNKNKITPLEDCLTGLQWYALEVGDREEINMLCAESGSSFGVLTSSTDRKRAAGVGFVDSVDNPAPKPSAAAAVVAGAERDTLLAERSGDRVWLLAVQGGVVVPGTDVFLTEAEVLVQIDQLQEQDEFALAGSFMLERLAGADASDGESVKTFLAFVQDVDLKKCRPVSLRGGMGSIGWVLKALMIAVVVGVGGWQYAESAYLAPERERVSAEKATDERVRLAKRSLKNAKSGHSPVWLYLLSEETLESVPVCRGAGYAMVDADCSRKGCELSFRQQGDSASITALAELLGQSEKEINYSADGEVVKVHFDHNTSPKSIEKIKTRRYWKDAEFLRKSSVAALEPAERHTASLIDVLNLLKRAYGVSFAVTESRPPRGIIYDGVRAELTYRRGEWQVSGDLWPSSLAVHLIDEMGGYIERFYINRSNDTFDIKGYYLAK